MRRWLKNVYGRSLVARHGFWFVDIPRTSSSSIHSELGKHFGRAYGKKNVDKKYSTPQIFSDHVPAKIMREILGQSLWDSIFTFTVVRNPWDRTFSMYNYRKKIGNLPSDLSFRKYVLALGSYDGSLFKSYHFRYGSSDFVLGDNGGIIVDFIAKFENRSEDLKYIASKLNIENFGSLRILNAIPDGEHYSEFYDSEMIEIVRKVYAKDVELFNYDF